MQEKKKRILGLLIAALGVGLLALNAVDYVLKWNRISSGVSGIGIALADVGAGLARHATGSG